jgi:hypothetical protein
MTLLDDGWTEEQAQGLLQSLNLDGGTPKWKWEHLQRLRSWCSTHEKDSTTVDGQLEFVAHDLCDTYEGVGMALSRAKTVEESREAAEPYMKRLRATEESFRPTDTRLWSKSLEVDAMPEERRAPLAARALNYSSFK